MGERKPFVLRLDPATMAALKAWAADDLRSLNGQMEFLLRRALRESGRLPGGDARRGRSGSEAASGGAGTPDGPEHRSSRSLAREPVASAKDKG